MSSQYPAEADADSGALEPGNQESGSQESPNGGPRNQDPQQAAQMARILDRETHSSRAGVAGLAAILVVGLCAYSLLESAVRAIGQPPWLIDPQTAAERLVVLPEGFSPLLLGSTGAVLAMVGLFFFLNAVLPGRRARHIMTLANNRTGVVVDDEVIASSLARRARTAANVMQEQVMVVVSRNDVLVNVRPTSGIPIQANTIQSAVEAELDGMGLSPRPRVRVNVAESGVVGA